MQAALSFTAIHELLAIHECFAWEVYWKKCGKQEGDLFKFYPHYIAALIKKIKTSGAKRVFIIHKERVFFLAGFLAALHAGVPIILPPSDALGVLKDLLRPEDALLTDQEVLAELTPLFILMDKVEINPQDFVKFTSFDPSKVFVTFYTSGSTGTPKAVQKALKQLEAEVEVLEEMWGMKGNKGTFLSTVPHHHIYGLLFSLLWPVCGGYPLRSETFSYWEDLLRQDTTETYIISSPSHLGRFPSVMDEKGKFNTRHVFSSGGPLSFEVAQAAQEFLDMCPIEVYGSTETGGIAYRQQAQRNQPWTKFKCVDLFEGEEKRLGVKSPYLPDGLVYQTEDIVSLESDHSFHLLGRADRIVKVEGKRISLLEMERRLQDFDLIQDAFVIPLETIKRDELGSIIVLSPQGQERIGEIGKAQFVREIRKNLSLYFEAIALPRKWRFVSELPLHPLGKRSYSLLKNYF